MKFKITNQITDRRRWQAEATRGFLRLPGLGFPPRLYTARILVAIVLFTIVVAAICSTWC